MELYKLKRAFVCVVFLSVLCIGVIQAAGALADTDDNVSGYAWSENIGWISSNCTDTSICGTSDYGITVADDGTISGYAWSENIGWITFNEGDLTGCQTAPCKASVDLSCPGGHCAVSGWARVLAVDGGWSGWIKLGGVAQDGSPYPLYIDSATGEFHGWGWADMVVGWISFNCADTAICDTSDYKWKTTRTFQHGPTAAMSCDGSQCAGGTCDPIVWIAYRPVADPTPCIYRIVNDSTDPDGEDDIVSTEWQYKVRGADDSTYQPVPGCPSFAGISDCTIQSGITAGEYTIKLTVMDAASNSDSTTHDLTLRGEVMAGFMCSLDDVNWQSCTRLSGNISKDETVYFKDDPLLPDHSVASEGAVITNRLWELNGVQLGGNEDHESTTIAVRNNIIRLTVTDSNGRSDYQQYNLTAKGRPEWEEVNPVGMLMNRVLAGIYRFWSN